VSQNASVKYSKAKRVDWLFISCITLPILILVASQALFARAFINWAAPFVIGASLASAVLLVNVKPRYWIGAIAFNHVLLMLFYHWPIILDGVGVEQSKKNSPYYRLSGWEELTEKVSSELDLDNHQNSHPLVSVDRDVLAYVGHYASFEVNELYYWNPDRTNIRNHYDLVNDLSDLNNKHAYFISSKPISTNTENSFDYVEYLGMVEHEVSLKIRRTVHLYKVRGFHGYTNI
jgi:hypothetical protein